MSVALSLTITIFDYDDIHSLPTVWPSNRTMVSFHTFCLL